jgi:hypothetical protein
MPDPINHDTGITGSLTDGTGVSSLTVPKFVKDFIVDALLGIAAGFGVLQITEIPQTQEGLTVAAFAVGKALIQAAYRVVLKWGQTP